ncbi:MAG TPA: hypothetical protein VEC01_06070 [Noviherbaspirillum sp.]|uniref:hypothetical protein n=1 Tax=Noviherbaspirillum sp. TaxID=1926288 RepID=UPI002D707C0E|nr:hypothetical protein [Noviherbaspirillum sp.]HYD94872.1 hypothetical protein [Noviherbaspirillum sp.]
MARRTGSLRAGQLLKAACGLAAAFSISSCGGGGTPAAAPAAGSTPDAGAPPASLASPVASAPPPTSLQAAGGGTTLLISEVSTSYYSNDVAWLELYNPTADTVELSRYTLRSSSIDLDSGSTSYEPATFTLPAVALPPGAYLVIAGKTSLQLQDNAQIKYVRSGSSVPFWNGSGSLELVSGGATADFVRFGTSTAAPTSGGTWNGASVAALPSGPEEHGKSIVRLAMGGMADTNAAADWSLVNFATPAGKNDVPPGIVDSDRDGIPDSAKFSGGTYAGLDLYAMGARRGRRDIFVEIDYMDGNDVATTPRREALQKLEAAFAAKGIALHIDAGKLYGAEFSPAAYNLGGGNRVPFSACVELDTSTAGAGARAGCTSFQSVKHANFDVRRRLVFHYALFANSLNTNGGAGPSGISEILGNDMIIALGGYGFLIDSEIGLNMLINMQASTLMHEFGHNLGLQHGGNEEVNYKPNHYSIMNYMYQFAGLSETPSSIHAADRYYLAYGLKGVSYCGLVENSPCGDGFLMSYSDGQGADLDESRLSELDNIGRGSTGGAYADWDNNGRLTAGVFGRNINTLDGSSRSVLRDYNEWGNLRLPFARNFSGSSSGRSLSGEPPAPRVNPMNHLHANRHVTEAPLPPLMQDMIRNLPRGRHVKR